MNGNFSFKRLKVDCIKHILNPFGNTKHEAMTRTSVVDGNMTELKNKYFNVKSSV